MTPESFSRALLDWFDREGRHDLPWQQAVTPYRVWVSEIMLQQTQVTKVIPYYQRFLAAFPHVQALAAADRDAVLHHWTGLGYYARARNLHRAARIVVEELGGDFPESLEGLTALPGIGRSTAGAILAIACGVRAPILDGNVKRVLCRYHALAGWPGQTSVQKVLWDYAEHYTPERRVGDYTQAMMDLGATLCTRGQPRCEECPLKLHCAARAEGDPSRYPTPRPRRERPLKEAWLLLLEDEQGRFLLQRRPPVGIWGGLWSPPQYATETALRQDWALAFEEGQRLAPREHGFSHFRLQMHPLQIPASQVGTQEVREAPSCWYDPGAPEALGLAAPIRKLLHELGAARDKMI